MAGMHLNYTLVNIQGSVTPEVFLFGVFSGETILDFFFVDRKEG